MRLGLKMFTLENYRQLAQPESSPLHTQFVFYDNLFRELTTVPYDDKKIQKKLGADTHPKEKEIYFETAKALARLILQHCEHGAYLAVDAEIKSYYGAQSPTKHHETIEGFAKEARNINHAILKFPQVKQGIAHLEELLKQNGT